MRGDGGRNLNSGCADGEEEMRRQTWIWVEQDHMVPERLRKKEAQKSSEGLPMIKPL